MKSFTVLLALTLAATSMAQTLGSCEQLCVPQCAGKNIYGASCDNNRDGSLVATSCSCGTSRRARSVVAPLVNREEIDPCEAKCIAQCGKGQVPSYSQCEGANQELTRCECMPADVLRRSAPVSPLVTRSVVSPLVNREEDPCEAKCNAQCGKGQVPNYVECQGATLTKCSCIPAGGLRRSAPVSPLVTRSVVSLVNRNEISPCEAKCVPKCPKGQTPSFSQCEGRSQTLTKCECEPIGGVRRSAPVSPLVTRALSEEECEKQCNDMCAARGRGKGHDASCTAGQLVTCNCGT
ncbi:hypothetical protein HYFRA_00000256 [Hymenoscyphus fraxineus]|uniref:Uncharacterized protein n=1 Tax=Hymenoscyphus fraxineus TaxID=746836 RepID=A0A9N9L557_9HELO|nr:hypothetical protein HYFRA_00000256 [Hymenoscyphus fraxineus]